MSQALFDLEAYVTSKFRRTGASFFFLKMFLMWIFLKTLLNLLQYCFCFMFLIFWPWGMWDFSSPTRDWTSTTYVGGHSLNHWTARKTPRSFIFGLNIFIFLFMGSETCQNFPGHYFPGSDHHYVISKPSLQEPRLILCTKAVQQPLGILCCLGRFWHILWNFWRHNPSPMPLERILCSQRLSHVPFKHNGNWAIELYTGFSKGSSIMWQLCHGQQ